MQASQIAEEACQKIETITVENNALLKERAEIVTAMEELKRLHSKLEKEVSNSFFTCFKLWHYVVENS